MNIWKQGIGSVRKKIPEAFDGCLRPVRNKMQTASAVSNGIRQPFSNGVKILIMGVVIGIMPFLGFAQIDVERATKDVDRSFREEGEERLRTSPKKTLEFKRKETKREEEKDAKFLITEIKLVGCESFSPDEFKHIIERYENKETSLEELEAFAKQIEREYLRKGVIAACFLPPQEIEKGIVTLQIIEAKMGSLEIDDHKYFKRERIAYYWQILPGDVLHYDKISQGLNFINKNPDREATVSLRAGKKPGTTDMLLSVATKLPIHLTSSFSKEGGGPATRGYGIKHNNFLGCDDTLLGGYKFGPTFGGLYAYHTIPITRFGTSLMYGFSYTKAFPKGDYEIYGIDSRAKNSSFTIYQDILKEGEQIGQLHFGIEAKDKSVSIKTGTLNRDRLRILKLGGSYTHRGLDTTTYIRPEYSQGINFFGARKKNSLSSRGAKNTFSTFTLDVQHKKTLPLDLQASLKIKGQLSSTRLPTGFSLGGMDSVRGYPSGDFLADTAMQANLELLIPAFFIPEKIKIPYAAQSLKEDTTALVFFDYGYGRRKESSAAGKKTHNLRSIGAGLRIRLANQTLLRLEWGFPVGDKTITAKGKSSFHVSLDFEDKLPEEIERIKGLREKGNITGWAWALLNEELKKPTSLLKEKLDNYLRLAQVAYEKKDLEGAKKYYEKISNTGTSLYQQTENYAKECVEHQKELKEYEKLAVKYYKEGKPEKAKEIWQKIVQDAKVKPLIVEF
ncbi:MAG: ShlB/FhaC/HecB family hemolysin secretion/activation protein [Candidatus Omnitrophota bacterium]